MLIERKSQRDALTEREPDYEIIEFEEGKGHVSSLLADWMARFPKITVPTPSARMRGICERRGFKSEMAWFEEFGEHGECMVWRHLNGA